MEKKNPDVDRLIDFSSEDDCLISSSSFPSTTSATGFLDNPNDPEYFELSVVGTALEREDAVNHIMERKDLMLCESSEPEKTRKTAKCNLRKSLAWDKAFFTSEGVLEPEELSFLNGGLKKADLHPLLRIEEDVRKSAESTSTLDSENLTLESLEIGLFEDVRASIQKTSKASNISSSSNQTGSGKCDVQKLQSSRKVESTSRNKTKPIAAIKSQVLSAQSLERTKKKPENIKKDAAKIKREAQGTKKEASALPRAVQAAARSGRQNTSSLRPPKIAGRVNLNSTSPTNISLGANRFKIDKNPPETGRRETIVGLKRPVFGDPSANSQSNLSPKSSSSSSGSATKMGSAASCTSPNVCGSGSSNSSDKSPVTTWRKKINCRNDNVPSSTVKSPQRNLSKSKTQIGNPRLAAYLTSTSKLNSSISPASSLDGLSSESSSSASVDKRYSSVKSLDISSPRKGFHLERGVSQPDMQKHNHGQHSLEQKRTGLPSPRSKKAIPGSGITRPAVTDVCRSSKPSGLRMPSPKIGFFDAEKSMETSPTGRLQFHPGVPSAIPKHGAATGGLRGGALRVKPGKLQPLKTMTGRSSMNSPRTGSGCPPHPQELSNASPKICTTKTTGENCSSIKSTSLDDNRTLSERHSVTGVVREMNNPNGKSLDSFFLEGEKGGQADFVNDKDTTRGDVSAIKAGREDCPRIAQKLQRDIESHLETGVERELTNTSLCPSHPGEVSSASMKLSATDSGENSSYVTSTSHGDGGNIRGNHSAMVEVGELTTRNRKNMGSLQKNSENVGQDDFVNDMDTPSEQLSAIQAREEDCLNISRKQQSGVHTAIGTENHLKTGEVGGLRDRLCSSPPNKENGSHDSFDIDTGTIREKVSATKAARVSQGITLGQNDLSRRTSSESCLRRGEVSELMKTAGESIFVNEGEDTCQDALTNDAGSLREKLLNLNSTLNTPKSGSQISCKPSSDNKAASGEVGKKLMQDPGHLESNPCHDSSEKENSLCYGNQVHPLGRQMGFIDNTMEEFIVKKGSSLSQCDVKGDSTADAILVSNSKEVLVDGHGDYPKLLLKEDVQTDSS